MTISEMVRDLQSLLKQGTSPDCQVTLPGGEEIGGVEEHTHGVVVYQRDWQTRYNAERCPSCVSLKLS